MPTPINRTVLFDPGSFSTLHVNTLEFLDDIFITHNHSDHMDLELIKQLVMKFPNVQITAPQDARQQLLQAGIDNVSSETPQGVRFFDAPHETIRPYFPADPPDQVGYHYLGLLSDPGDSHSFSESMPILALPVTAPWGDVVKATALALKLKPKYVLPIHDWHWRDEARQSMYDTLEQRFDESGITFLKLIDGVPVVINL
jgi:L-ascorbate metabolism protein UlaG (beta-lactamase superfamily)